MTGTWPNAEAFKFLGKFIAVFTVDGRETTGTVITLDENFISMTNEQGYIIIFTRAIASIVLSNKDAPKAKA
jgi:sRNA-binding regulator protein Hfq